jgi:hypothetical protein
MAHSPSSSSSSDASAAHGLNPFAAQLPIAASTVELVNIRSHMPDWI